MGKGEVRDGGAGDDGGSSVLHPINHSSLSGLFGRAALALEVNRYG